MKQSLALLLAYLFFQTQIWAFAPVYPGNPATLSGTYAGTMVGQVFFNQAGGIVAPTNNTVSTNGLGVFQIGQPDSGLGSGVFAMFAGGATYTGAVISIVDPTELTMTGVMEGNSTITEDEDFINLTTGQVTVAPFQQTLGILGVSFTTQITFNQASNNGGSASTRILGTGAANYQGVNQTTGALFNIGSSTLIIDGFLQSNNVSGQIDLSTLTQTQSQGGGS